MFSLLVRKELLDQIHSLRFTVACLICPLLVLSSIWVRAGDYERALRNYHVNQITYHNEIMEYLNLNHRGLKVDKPLNPMQIFVSGIARRLTFTTRISSEFEPRIEEGHARNPITVLFPPIDLLFFVGVVMSLLAIAFSYDAVSGEKELGTLKLLMSYSAPRDVVLLAKWLGGYLALMAPFVVSLLGGLVFLGLFEEVNPRTEEWLGLGLVALLAFFYLGAIFSLGLWLSVRTQQVSTSIIGLLVAWVLLVLILPNAAPFLAAQIEKTRSPELVAREKEEVERVQLQRWHDEGEAFSKSQEGLSDRQRLTNHNLRNGDHFLRVSHGQKQAENRYQNELGRQIRLSRWFSRLSPLASFTYAASDLAATGVGARRRFMDRLWAYRDEITGYMYGYGVEDYWYENMRGQGYPRFRYTEPGLGDRIGRIWMDVLLLALWNTVFFLAAYRAFRRYDVT